MTCTSPFGLTPDGLHDYVERADVTFARARVLLKLDSARRCRRLVVRPALSMALITRHRRVRTPGRGSRAGPARRNPGRIEDLGRSPAPRPCRQLDDRGRKRRFKALLASRLAFWLRGGLGSEIRACPCRGIRSRSGLQVTSGL